MVQASNGITTQVRQKNGDGELKQKKSRFKQHSYLTAKKKKVEMSGGIKLISRHDGYNGIYSHEQRQNPWL